MKKNHRNAKKVCSASAAAAKKRTFRTGSFGLLTCLLVIAIVVAVNMVVGALPTAWTRLDVTANRIYSFSKETRDLLDTLKEPVTVYLYAEDGNEDVTLAELLRRYARQSDCITVEQVDPVEQPLFLSQYTGETLDQNSMIVVSETRTAIVAYDDIYAEEYSETYQTYDNVFHGEAEVTSALDYVTTDVLPVAYRIAEHGCGELPAAASTALQDEYITVEDLNLLTVEVIPADADLLILQTPASDFSETETELLADYLAEGGHLLVFTDTMNRIEMPNLYGLLESYGVALREGLVIEGSENHCLSGFENYLLPELVSHDITDPITEDGGLVLLAFAQALDFTVTDRDTLSVVSLADTSADAYLKSLDCTTLEQEDGDPSGTFHVAAAISEPVSDTEETRIVWFPTAYLLDSQCDYTVGGYNTDLFVNAVNWMVDREEHLTVQTKSIYNYIAPTTAQALFWQIVMVVVLPGSVLTAGIAVFVRRRKR